MGFIPKVYMETCPDEEDIYPCVCKEGITVTCSKGFFNPLDSLKALQQSLSMLIGKRDVRLILEDLNVNISSNFFAGIGIVELEFHSCRIDSSKKDDQPVLLGLENHLRVRYLFSNVILILN